MTYEILVTDNVHEQGIKLFREAPDFRVDVKIGLPKDELLTVLGRYQGLVVRSETKITADVLEAGSNLRVIGRAGTGLDNVDVPEATRRGIVVMNTPGGNSMATAEHTIALIMTAHRHIPQAVESMKAGKWEKKKFQGTEMAGRTLGVIGLGRIGSLVASRASRGLKMNVIGYDPVSTPAAAAQVGVKLVGLEEVFKRADVITVHTPLNKDTRGLVDAGAFAKMKDGVIVVNCARGGIIDEAALLSALESGKAAAAALDVYSQTPPGASPLATHPRVVATPHLGASTGEAQVNVAVAVCEQIIDFLRNGVVRNAANVPTVDARDLLRMGPYLDLGGRLSRFLAGLCPATVREMEVIYRGTIASWDFRAVTNAALVGLLSGFEGTEVNPVNAPVIAAERGIRVSETTLGESAEHGSSIEIRMSLADGTVRSVQGAIIRRVADEPRIIAVDRFITEAVPAGPMLVVTNRDVPGMIAAMAGALARGAINIAQMNLSRNEPGGQAMSIINIDTPADEAVLDAIRAVAGILSVTQVVLEQ